MAKRVSIINFKGGVGKTTLAFHLATGLARSVEENRVLLIDVDHQSSLSVLCAGAVGWQRAVDSGQTVDNLFRHFVDPSSTFPDNEIIDLRPKTKVWSMREGRYHCWDPGYFRARYRTLDLVPASLSLDDTEIELTGTYRGDGN